MPERNRNFRVMLSDDELAMIHMLAEHAGLTASDIVRQHIRQAYAETFGDKKPRMPRR